MLGRRSGREGGQGAESEGGGDGEGETGGVDQECGLESQPGQAGPQQQRHALHHCSYRQYFTIRATAAIKAKDL